LIIFELVKTKLKRLSTSLKGSLQFDKLYRSLYATDASVYRKVPMAVAFPKDEADIQQLIAFAKEEKTTLIPRTAGTSLAGQCVGEGIVVDVSKHFTEILSLNLEKKQVTVQPGVIRDDLNRYLSPYNLFFGPNTSTANRCMMGGMVGNNSSGTTSIQYGVTRDKVLALRTLLSDGSIVVFEDLDEVGFREKTKVKGLEGNIYRSLLSELESPDTQGNIRSQFPKPEIHRRNTGYAVDELLHQLPFKKTGKPFNMCSLLSGSEGTLAFTTEITLQLDDIPPAFGVVVASHHTSITHCMETVVPAMKHNLFTCEMMDKVILDCTKNNREQQKNRFFVEGDPQAILMLEVRDHSIEGARAQAKALVATLEQGKHSYAHPILEGKEIDQAMELRKAGLGLLGNLIGDKKAVACIEDTAVALDDLAPYIAEFSELMTKYDQEAVYYAHAGAGEIHLRPILNLKKQQEVDLFRKITTDVAHLVKKYQGSMSGEHGDGIVRAEFIPLMIGEDNYRLIKKVKNTFDPNNVFNSGKIVDAFPMDESLRYEIDREEPQIETLFNFEDQQGILRATEKCNGSGDCRKLPAAGGTMCPSYRATRDEKDSTRARANALREFLTQTDDINAYDHKELKQVFDLCLSCKACASECPSNVDVATLKAEFEYQYQKANGSSLRTKSFAYATMINKLAARTPKLSNAIFSNMLSANILKRSLGIAKGRSLPLLDVYKESSSTVQKSIKEVYLMIDEFTHFLDGSVGQDAVYLLEALNYQVHLITGLESGRAFISKGFLEQAKHLANQNVAHLKELVSSSKPLLGIEPSAILTLKDEYIRLVNDSASAKMVSNDTYLIENFLWEELKQGNIKASQFTSAKAKLKIHGHCHQKALSTMESTFALLNLPENYPSGCCGMAGSFGYEKEHFEVSMQIGEQTLFPAVRKAELETIIVANGTSCRHQIKDGTGRVAKHPISVLKEALK